MLDTLFVDLTNKKIVLEKTDSKLWQKYLGGRGYAAKLLFDMTDKDTAPFSEKNPLIFAIGPLTGSRWPTGARYSVTTRSPLTGIYGVANSGGYFGPEMRRAGLDAIVITGKAQKPVALVIDDTIELVDASDLWGKNTGETDAYYRNAYKGARVACIGPAGENLVRIASVINDAGRAAARCGVGAVMGWKNLKAVVVKGNRTYPYPEDFMQYTKAKFREVASSDSIQFLKKFGTAGLVAPKNIVGDLPSYNHQQVQFEEGNKVDAQALTKYIVKRTGCFACPIQCSPHSKITGGDYECEVEGPEYETISALGPNVGNGNIESIIYANLLCNQLGLDTISTGGVISFAMECSQNNVPLGNGLKSLHWGDDRAIVELIRKIAYRDGIGDLLADGVKAASEKIGPASQKYAMHVKGLELPRQDPRIARGFGLGHGTSNRGACHMYSLPTIDTAGLVHVGQRYFPHLMPELMEVASDKHKPEMVTFTEALNAVVDAVGVCKFSTSETYATHACDLAQALNLLLGYQMDEKDILKAGERIVNLERMYNVRLGLDRKNDRLPERFTKEPATVYRMKEMNGKMEKVAVLSKNLIIGMEDMLTRYYELRAWDQNGIPTAKKLEELGLQELIPFIPRQEGEQTREAGEIKC